MTSGDDTLERWRRRGSWVDVDGRRIFRVDTGERDAPVLLVLHGFPSCSYDYHRVLPTLAERHRVVVHDHLGFGLSEKRRRDRYSLLDQARFAAHLWEQMGIRSGHLVAHDYGTSVATELLALRQEGSLEVEIQSVTLSNGSIYLELARLLRTQRWLRHPVTGPLFARLISRRFFRARMRGLWGDPSRFDDRDVDALWSALTRDGGRAVLSKLSRYLDERVRYRDRWVGALRRLDLPSLVLWGRSDPIAVEKIAERLAGDIPAARLEWLEGVGHYPMLEAPAAWSRALREFVLKVDDAQSPESSR